MKSVQHLDHSLIAVDAHVVVALAEIDLDDEVDNFVPLDVVPTFVVDDDVVVGVVAVVDESDVVVLEFLLEEQQMLEFDDVVVELVAAAAAAQLVDERSIVVVDVGCVDVVVDLIVEVILINFGK